MKINIYAAKTAINRLPKPEIDSENIITTLEYNSVKYTFEFSIICDGEIPNWYLINYISNI
jgi:hypothetical protein